MWADEDGWRQYVEAVGGTHAEPSRMAEVEAFADGFELDREFEAGGTEASQSFEL